MVAQITILNEGREPCQKRSSLAYGSKMAWTRYMHEFGSFKRPGASLPGEDGASPRPPEPERATGSPVDRGGKDHQGGGYLPPDQRQDRGNAPHQNHDQAEYSSDSRAGALRYSFWTDPALSKIAQRGILGEGPRQWGRHEEEQWQIAETTRKPNGWNTEPWTEW